MYFIPQPDAFSAVPSFQSFPGVSGFELSVVDGTHLNLLPGFAKSLTSDFSLQYPAFAQNQPSSITIDTSVIGAGGCFPVSLQNAGMTADTVFGVYVIDNQDGVSSGQPYGTEQVPSAIIATGNNFLPYNYTAYRRVGLVYVDHTTFQIIPMIQIGSDNDREYILQDPLTAVTGSATSATEVDLTANAGVVPPNVYSRVNFNLSLAAFAAGSYVEIEPVNFTAASVVPTKFEGNVASTTTAVNIEMICGLDATTNNAAIKYLVDNAGSTATISVCGFTDSLGLRLF